MNKNGMKLSRRHFSIALGGTALPAALPRSPLLERANAAQDETAASVVIDLDGELESIHPSLAYSGREWSVVHSIYDSILYIDASGAIVPLAAKSVDTDDAITFRVTMRDGMQFHDGTALTADSLRDSWEFLNASESQVTDLFAVIDDIEVTSDLDAVIRCAVPSPWLPAQIATWLMLVPPGYTREQALSAPVGTGPYMLASYGVGEDVDLVKNPDYALADIKGSAIADEAVFRIVPDAATRVADIATGTSNIADHIPQDFVAEVEAQGATILEDPIVGSQWVRIATDVAPFDDVRVRQAMNHAVDSVTIAETLMGSGVQALGSIFPDERAPGFLESISPYAYDPELAKALLDEAGVEPGLDVSLEITQGARSDVAEALAAFLEEVGFVVEVVVSDRATFNEGWSDPERPVLRMATWSPLYEPHTLLNLVFASSGFLSRSVDETLDSLIADSATEPDADERRQLFEQINQHMHDDPPAIFLWNLSSTYAVEGSGELWTPIGNDQIVPTVHDGA